MKLSTRSKDYIVPEYSLTGDLLSFLTCNLQYRYQNKGTLPPSTPVQLWFGEFIHGVMEEAYLKWDYNVNNKGILNNKNNLDIANSNLSFPWDWKEDIRPIESMIEERLQTRGLYPPMDYYCSHNSFDGNSYSCPDENHPHKLLYSARAEAAINIWGPYLFPLIDDAEILIKGMRDMPNYVENESRSVYYAINGVIDVLSSLKLDEIAKINLNPINEKENSFSRNTFQASLDSFMNNGNKNNPNYSQDTASLLDKAKNKNRILKYLANDQKFNDALNNYSSDEYEIIIDYKGMKRPSLDSENWTHHSWQILTYSWLRQMQEDSKPVIAGIIFYLNELVPSTEDLVSIRDDIKDDNTDISMDKISENDLEILLNWNPETDLPIHRDLSNKFKMDRSIRIINIEDDLVENSLNEFDQVVNSIETSTIKEIMGMPIKEAWKAEADKRTCDACDFKNFCKKNKDKSDILTIP